MSSPLEEARDELLAAHKAMIEANDNAWSSDTSASIDKAAFAAANYRESCNHYTLALAQSSVSTPQFNERDLWR